MVLALQQYHVYRKCILRFPRCLLRGYRLGPPFEKGVRGIFKSFVPLNTPWSCHGDIYSPRLLGYVTQPFLGQSGQFTQKITRNFLNAQPRFPKSVSRKI